VTTKPPGEKFSIVLSRFHLIVYRVQGRIKADKALYAEASRILPRHSSWFPMSIQVARSEENPHAEIKKCNAITRIDFAAQKSIKSEIQTSKKRIRLSF
jgi:hypothetical protein